MLLLVVLLLLLLLVLLLLLLAVRSVCSVSTHGWFGACTPAARPSTRCASTATP
jgi:uncharacterized protein HemY